MKSEIIKRIIYVNSAAVIIFFCGINFFLLKNELVSKDSLRVISGIITFSTFFWALYFRYGWKWPGLKHLVYKPNLNGTWIGSFKSDWQDKNGVGVPKADMVLVIRQTFLRIHITTFTHKFTSYSYGESFLINNLTRQRRLIYLYSKNPMQPNSEDDRQGTCELQVFGKPENQLTGQYWTHQKTNGFIKVKHRSSDHIETFEDAKTKWESPEHWNLITD